MSGRAMNFARGRCDHTPKPARFNRTIAKSNADKNAERSLFANGFGPPVICPADRKSYIRFRDPIDLGLHRTGIGVNEDSDWGSIHGPIIPPFASRRPFLYG